MTTEEEEEEKSVLKTKDIVHGRLATVKNESGPALGRVCHFSGKPKHFSRSRFCRRSNVQDVHNKERDEQEIHISEGSAG